MAKISAINKIYSQIGLLVLFTIGCIIFGALYNKQTAYAVQIAGAPSYVYPLSSGPGEPPTYMVNELCSGPTDCMRGKITTAEIYVPKTVANGTVETLTILDGCDNTGQDINGSLAFTWYRMADRSEVSLGQFLQPNSDSQCDGGGNVVFRFQVNIPPPNVPNTTQGDYYTYYFIGEAIGNGNTDGFFYQNMYRLQAWDTNLRIGLSVNFPLTCVNSNYPYSCPTNGLSYSSIGQPSIAGLPNGGNYSQVLNIPADCTVDMYGGIDLYDLDAGIYGQTNIQANVYATDPFGNVTQPLGGPVWLNQFNTISPYPPPGPPYPQPYMDSGNNGHLWLPLPFPSLFTFKRGYQYALSITGLTRTNTLQLLVNYNKNSDGSGGQDCHPAQPPGGAIASATCNSIDGWAIDADWPSGSLQVDLYIDGISSGNYIGRYTTNLVDNNVNTYWGVTGAHNFSIPVPNAYKYGNHTAYMYALGVDSTGTYDNMYQPFANSPQSYVSCPVPTATVSCGPAGITFDQKEYGTSGTLTTNIQSGWVANGPNVTINSVTYSESSGSMVLSGVDTFTPNPIPPGGTGTITRPAKFNTPGLFPVNAIVYYSSTLLNGATVTGNFPCTGTVDVSGMPYLKVYGGDVIAGGGYNPSTGGACTLNASANIYAFARNTGSGYAGSSGQLGVISPNIIQHFFSASNRTAGAMPPQGLTFANTNAAQVYGGSFGIGTCITDYFNSTRDSTISGGTFTDGASMPLGRKQYTWTGPQTLTGKTVPAGSQTALYVEGDLFINGDIAFATAGSVATMPYLAVIVHGNIYISPAVKRLDGLYVAEPSAVANTGRIYTCAPGAPLVSSTYSAGQLYANCSNPLAINGALIAQQVRFLRTINSLKDSTLSSGGGEVPNFADGSGVGGGANTKAAEVINFTPEMYLAPSPLKDPNNSSGSTSGLYDAIYGLSPIY